VNGNAVNSHADTDTQVPGLMNGDIKPIFKNGSMNNNTGESPSKSKMQHVNLQQKVGLTSGVALIVGTMIGKSPVFVNST